MDHRHLKTGEVLDVGRGIKKNTKGFLKEIHKVPGGWIYVFHYYVHGSIDSATLSSTFVPEPKEAS